MIARTLLIACKDPDDVNRFSTALAALPDQGPCQIVLLHVVEKIFPVATLAALGGGLMLPPPPEEAEDRWREARAGEARRQLAELRPLLPARWPVRLKVEHGPPAETICRVAAEEQATLILLTSHRRGRLRRWLPGRAARRVIDTAPCPVAGLGADAEMHRPGPLRPAAGLPAGRSPGEPLTPPLAVPPRGA